MATIDGLRPFLLRSLYSDVVDKTIKELVEKGIRTREDLQKKYGEKTVYQIRCAGSFSISDQICYNIAQAIYEFLHSTENDPKCRQLEAELQALRDANSKLREKQMSLEQKFLDGDRLAYERSVAHERTVKSLVSERDDLKDDVCRIQDRNSALEREAHKLKTELAESRRNAIPEIDNPDLKFELACLMSRIQASKK